MRTPAYSAGDNNRAIVLSHTPQVVCAHMAARATGTGSLFASARGMLRKFIDYLVILLKIAVLYLSNHSG